MIKTANNLRKRSGTFHDIVKEINQYTRERINYSGIGDMKTFIRETAQWLSHRLRQLIWKRSKRVFSRFYGLMRYGIDTGKKLGKLRIPVKATGECRRTRRFTETLTTKGWQVWV